MVGFMVDTGAQYAVLSEDQVKLSHTVFWEKLATGIRPYYWKTNREVDLGTGLVFHSFLLIPDAPCPLLGQNLLNKVKTKIHFEDDSIKVMRGDGTPRQVLILSLAEEYQLFQEPRLQGVSPDEVLLAVVFPGMS